ncbi:MAG: hypothetical protein ACLQBJ_04215 [Bryobacteraceae bacterium]
MFKTLVLLITGGCLSALVAVPPPVGVVSSTGEFRVDGATIQGNSTLFDGTVVESVSARSVLQISGARITLLPASRATVYRDRAVIEQGSGIVSHARQLVVEAASLRITPAAGDAIVQVERTGQSQVVVTTQAGSAEVRNASGLLIASVNPNRALAFDAPVPANQASGAVKLTGVVQSEGGSYFLTDSTTGVKVQLRGENLNRYVGEQVTFEGSVIPGATPAGGASEVVQVVTLNVVRPASNAASATTRTAAHGGGALSPAALAALIGGVTVTETLVSLKSVGALGSTTPVSRP